MSLTLDKRPDQDGAEYDNNKPGWRRPSPPEVANPDVNEVDDTDFESRFAGPSARPEDLPPGHPSRKEAEGDESAQKTLSPDELNDAETTAEQEPSLYHPDEKPEGKLKGLVSGKKNKEKKSYKKVLLAGGCAGGIAMIVALFVLLTFFKIPHFSQVLTASGYSRLNTILDERITQNIYDASLVEGEGSVPVQGRSLFDKLRGINPDADLARLGHEGKIKFQFGDEKTGFLKRKPADFKGIQFGDKNVSLDGITSELGYGDSYSKLGKVTDFRKRARVRYEFIEQAKSNVTTEFATERRYVRSNAFKAIADASGFDFKRWKQKGRNLIGEEPNKAFGDNLSEAREQVSGASPTETTGFSEVDDAVADIKNEENFAKNAAEHPNIDPTGNAFVTDTINAKLGTANKIRGAAEAVGNVTVLMSVACIVNKGLDSIPDIERHNVEQAEREGLQLAAAGAQVMHGDVSGEAAQAETRRIEHAELSPGYQYDTGDMTPTVPEKFSSPSVKTHFDQKYIDLIHTLTSPTTIATAGVTELIRQVPGLGDLVGLAQDAIDQKFCEALLSPAGMLIATGGEVFAQAAFAFFSAGSEPAASEGIAKFASREFIDELVTSLSSTAKGLFKPESLATVGAFSVLDVGMQYLSLMLANQTFSGGETQYNYYERARTGTTVVQDHSLRMSMYGRPLTPEEVKPVENDARLSVRHDFNNQSLFARYFSLKNPFSLVSSMAVSAPSSLSSAGLQVQQIGGTLGKLFSPSTIFKPLLAFMGHSYADQLESYNPNDGIQAWGFSQDELDKIKFDPSYSLEENEKIISPQADKLDEKYGECFTTASQYDADKLVSDGKCSPDALKQDDVFRWRIYRGLDAYTVEELTNGLTTP